MKHRVDASLDELPATETNCRQLSDGIGASGGEALIGNVPEPATWAMMLGGFGLIGGTLWARRRPAFSD